MAAVQIGDSLHPRIEIEAEKGLPLIWFQAMLTGMLYSRPNDPISYLEKCVQLAKNHGKSAFS